MPKTKPTLSRERFVRLDATAVMRADGGDWSYVLWVGETSWYARGVFGSGN